MDRLQLSVAFSSFFIMKILRAKSNIFSNSKMKSSKHSSWRPASDLEHKDVYFSSDMTKGNHNPIHR